MATVSFESTFVPVVHVEVCQSPFSILPAVVLKEHVQELLHGRQLYRDFILTEFSDPVLQEHAISVSASDVNRDLQVKYSSNLLAVHVFKLNEDGPAFEEIDDESDVTAASHWAIPNVNFQGMWENLIYDCDIKQMLLNYAKTTLLFSDQGVDTNIISWNRVILLHGPPGTGKTSLCKALAQKLSINMSDRYTHSHLVEINSHSLFSKWFSESGKLVQKMFSKIQEMVDDSNALVCVLIDEVESLTSARKSAMSGSEPSDAIRVVNALLTQIDQIKCYPNVMILTTSNVTGAIDLAFVDRADVKQYIGLPTMAAIFKIYHSCLRELARVGIIKPIQQLLDLRALEVMRFAENEATRLSLRLRDLAKMSEGLSGRTLRKIPFLAHALFSQAHTMTMEEYLDALEKAIKKQFSEKEKLYNAAAIEE